MAACSNFSKSMLRVTGTAMPDVGEILFVAAP
jgi:hypothetical protein